MGYVSRDALNHAAWSGIESGYGLHVAPDAVLVVRHEKTGKKLPQVVFEGLPDQQASAWRQVADQVNGDVRSGKAWVAAGIPVVAGVLRRITVPLASLSKAKRVLPSQLDLQLPFPVEACQYEFLDVEDSAPGQVRALALAVRDEDLSNLVQRIAQLGIDPVLVDHEGLALWSQARQEHPGKGLRVIAFLGGEHTSLVFGRDEQFLTAHGIRTTLSGAGSPEELCKRMQRIVRSQTLDHSIPLQWMWCGPGACDTAALKKIEGMLSADQRMTFSTVSRPAEFLGAAYARRAVEKDAYPCNFRTGPLAHPAFSALRTKRHRQTARTYAVAGLILGLLGVGWTRLLDIKIDRLQTQLAQQAENLVGSPVPAGQERLMVSRFMDAAKKTESPFQEALVDTRQRQLKDLLRFAALNQFTLHRITLTPTQLTLKGTAYDWDACDLLAQYLEPRGYRVEVVRHPADGNQRIPFDCRAEKKDGP